MICNKREIKSHNSSKKCRKAGCIPGVLYGKGMENLLFEISEMELNNELCACGEHGIINAEVEGNCYKSLIKEVQRDPVSRNILHIDLENIENDQKIIAEVPINYLGLDFLNKKGRVVQKERDTVKVECKPDMLPKYINFDLSDAQLGAVYRYSDMEISSEVSIVDDLQTVIVSVSNEAKTVELVDEHDEAKNDKEEK